MSPENPPTEPRGFRLRPDDVLFFRDGKPSTMGSDHYLRSLFPPYPSTLYGALRTRRLLDAGVSLRELAKDAEAFWQGLAADVRREVGEWGGIGSLRIRGPWLVGPGGDVLLPAPGDLAVVAAPDTETDRGTGPPVAQSVVRLYPQELAGGASHDLLPLVATDPKTLDDAGPAADWFVTPEGLAAWSRGKTPRPETLCHRAALWGDEARTGVGLEDDQRTAAQGRLYTFGTIRLRPGVTLGFDATGTAVEPRGLLRLGGERKTVQLEKGPRLPALPELPTGGGELLTVMVATPTVSALGAYPPGFGPGEPEGVLAGARVRLVSAAVQGSLPVGGWDMARGAPKPLRRAIPPGSVFLFECLEESAAAVAARLDGTTLCDDPTLVLQGFGLVVCGLKPDARSRRTPDGQ